MKEYNKLLGRIKECGFTQQEVAKRMGISAVTLGRKLNGVKDFKIAEIEKLSTILEIPVSKLHFYFFS